MLQDLRYAVRSLGRARGFATAAIATLALGMAANVIAYSIVNGLLIRPLPFGDRAARLVTLHSTHPTQAQDWDDSPVSYADLLDVRDRATTLEGVEGFFPRNLSLASASEAERVSGASVTPGLFRLLGVSPQLGRHFTDDDGAEPGFERVALISERLWQRLYGGDPAIVGQTIRVNARALTVIGVMPDGFAFPGNQDVWLPYLTSRDTPRDRRSLIAVGLLRADSSLADARAELGAIAAVLGETYPNTNRRWGMHVMPLRDFFVNDATRRNLTAMLPAVGLVLLVACANVAGLLVARGVSRQRELMVRAALGASRIRIVRLLLAESLVIATIAAGIALLAASWGLDALLASLPEPPVYWARFGIDGRVLAFTAIAALVAALASGLVPALRLVRDHSQAAPVTRTTSQGRAERRLQGALVAGQVALTFALLAGATLLARSAMALQHADAGFDPAPLLSLRLYMAGDAYDDPVARARTLQTVVNRLANLPGVESAAATGAIPADDGGDGIRLVPPDAAARADEEIGAQMVPMTPGLFETLGLELVEGRTFDSADADRVDGTAVIVSRRLADRFWPGEPAVGRDLAVRTDGGLAHFRVVGVAPDLVYEEFGEETAQSRHIVYVPHVRAGWRTMALLVRSSAAPEAVAPAVRSAVRDVDPAFAPYEMMSMTARRAFTTWGERFIGRTFLAFGLTALLLACVGVYGLTAYSAAQRLHEIGVRIAVGATRTDIVRLLVGHGVRLAIVGTLAGLPLAIAAARLLQDLLFETSPWTPAVWLMLPAALVAAVLAASYLPAYRASLTEPAVALREE